MLYRTVALASALVLGATAAYASGGHNAEKMVWDGLRNNPPIMQKHTVAPVLEGRSATAAPVPAYRDTIVRPDQPIYFGIATQGRDH